MRRTWNTSTALITTVSLILPAPLNAQSAEGVPEFLCADGSELPCATGIKEVPTAEMICETGTELPCEPGVFAVPKTAMICADGADLPCAEGVAASVRPEMVEVLTEMRLQSEAEKAAAAEAEAAAETEAAPESAAAEEAAPAETEAAPEAEAAEETAPTETEAAPEEEITAEAAAPEAEPEAEAPAPETVTEEATTGDAPAAEMAAESAPTESETMEAAEAPATETDAAGDEAALAEALAAAEVEGEAAESAEAATEATETASAEPASEADAQMEEADAAPVPELPVQPDAATGEAPVAAAAQAPAEAEASAEVTEEFVTEETARASNEDFANKVNETARAATGAAPAAGDDKGGLSDGEKAILLGLGAVAVGALLSNNREVALNSGDRVVVSRDDGSYQIIKDDNALLRQPGATVRTETFNDGSTRTTVTREDGTRIVTIRDAEYRVLRRVHVGVDGTETLLIDDTVDFEPVDVSALPAPAAQPTLSADADEEALRAALAREAVLDRRFSLAQVRNIAQVRALVPVIDLDAITFETGSAAIRPDQARSLSRLGRLIQSYVDENPREVFLIEGHTDAVGSAAYNLALSDRRAESVALALTEYFDVPPENLVVQGYGEEFLKIDTQAEERANRRASVRRITDLLRQASN